MMMIILAAALLLSIFYYLTRVIRKRKLLAHPSIVRAKGNWITGNIADFRNDRFLATLKEFPLKYGRITEFYLLTRRVLLVSDASLAKDILSKRPKVFGRLKALDYACEVLRTQTSLFNSRGLMWNRIRKATAPSFSHLNIVSKVADIAREINSWVKNMRQDSGAVIDMQKQAFMLTVRVITVYAFGLPTDHELVKYFVSNAFQQDVLKYFAYAGASATFPFPRFFWKYSSLFKLEVEGKESSDRVLDEGKKIINYKRQLVAEGKLTASQCMIDSMVLNESKSEKCLTDEEISINVRGFYIAGADTTAITIMWAAYFFALFPETAEKVRNEAIDCLFRGESPETLFQGQDKKDIDLSVFPRMTYTNAVVKEILRLKSPAHYLSVELEDEKEGATLSNGIRIEPGDRCFINIDGIHSDESIFENPSQFSPDRWLTEDADKLKVMEASYIPFGFGPRICPGMNLAIYESLLALSFFAYSFHFSLNCPPEEIIRIPSFVACANKMPMLLSPHKSTL